MVDIVRCLREILWTYRRPPSNHTEPHYQYCSIFTTFICNCEFAIDISNNRVRYLHEHVVQQNYYHAESPPYYCQSTTCLEHCMQPIRTSTVKWWAVTPPHFRRVLFKGLTTGTVDLKWWAHVNTHQGDIPDSTVAYLVQRVKSQHIDRFTSNVIILYGLLFELE